MKLQHATISQPLVNQEYEKETTEARLGGRWPLVTRVVWVVVFVPVLAFFVANLRISKLDMVSSILLIVATSMWFAVSGLLLWRKPDNRVVVLFSLGIMLIGGAFLAPHYVTLLAGHSWFWELILQVMVALGQSALLLFYLFPDGRFVPRWTRFLALGWVLVSFDQNLPGFIDIGPLSPWYSSFSLSIYRMVEVAFYASFMFSLLYRYLCVSTPVQRQQTRWIVFAFFIILVAASAANLEVDTIPYYFPALALPPWLAQEVSSLTNWLLPVLAPLAIGIALLRYRLWAIDLIINRALVYGLLTGTLAVLYIGFILVLQMLLSGFTGGNTLSLVASTLVIASLILPLRRRIQTIIDRRFYRRKYNAARTIEAFSMTLRGEIDLNTLSEQLVAVVQETMQPEHVSLWLYEQDSQTGKRYTKPFAGEKALSAQPGDGLVEQES